MIGWFIKNKSPKFQISVGLSGILVSLMLMAVIAGIVPDKATAVREGRAVLAESIAINSSILITRSDTRRMESILSATVSRNKDILSAAVRNKAGKPIVVVGDHLEKWQPLTDRHSTESQLVVPIYEGKKEWGQVELRFDPPFIEGWLGQFINSMTLLLSFISITSFILFYLYLGKMLKHLDPSSAVPDRVRSALDTMAEGLLVLDAKKNIVLANQAFSELVDKTSASLLGQQVDKFTWLDKNNEAVPDKDFPWTKTLFDGQTRTSRLIRLKLDDHELQTFMTNCSPVLSGSGKPAGVLISFDDVTELEQKEIELRLSKEEAELANRSKSEFLANMSHEIRTPMNAILGFAEVLKRGYGKNKQSSLKHINTITSSGNHLLGLINDILDLSKVEAGHIDIEMLSTPLHHIIQEVVQIMLVKANEKGISLEFKPQGPLPEFIKTDPGKVRQILTNLIGNAIKFTDKGGVTISTRLDTSSDTPMVTIDVADTGIGMSESQLSGVFNPFTQADSSITRRFGGTGLGLTISKKFAEAMGGDITVSSVTGEGSIFSTVLLTGDISDIKQISVDEILSTDWIESTTDVQQWEFPAARVLVVDDGDENRELLEVVLGDLGLTIDTAENGQLALDCLQKSQYDIVLMDVQMPVMDGYTAVRLMRKQGLTLPVIALTADAMMGAEQMCLDAGYSDYMTKPINLDLLIETLAKELNGVAVTTSQEANVDNETAESVEAIEFNGDDLSLDKITSSLNLSNPRFYKIVENFVIRLAEQLDNVQAALDNNDLETIAKLGHWLKGSAGSVGFSQFTTPAKALETAALNKDTDLVRQTLVDLESLQKRIALETIPADIKSNEKPKAEKEPALKLDYSIPEHVVTRLPMNNQRFKEIVQKFTTQLGDKITELEQSVIDKNYAQIADIAYWIKASAGSVGFDVFTRPASDLEKYAREQQQYNVEQIVLVIKQLSERITELEAS